MGDLDVGVISHRLVTADHRVLFFLEPAKVDVAEVAVDDLPDPVSNLDPWDHLLTLENQRHVRPWSSPPIGAHRNADTHRIADPFLVEILGHLRSRSPSLKRATMQLVEVFAFEGLELDFLGVAFSFSDGI